MTVKDLAIKLLKERKLRITSHRLSILSILMRDQSKAFSAVDLLKGLKKEMNASTIYRSLDKLLSEELVVKKVDVNGNSLYLLNHNRPCKHVVHPHLQCTECGVLECLPPFPVAYVNDLYASGVEGLDVVLRGVCKKCAKETLNTCK